MSCFEVDLRFGSEERRRKTMAKVQVTNVTVLDNPTAFVNPFQFDITFVCSEDLCSGRNSSIYVFQ